MFKDQCEAPRSGVDIEGNAFPDQPGSLLEELFWLRSWTNETYLWNDEVTDRDPNDFSDRVAYFDVLKTEALTPSGKPRDDFHFSELTEDFLERRNSAPAAGYGADFAILAASPPRDVRVVLTEPGSPAAGLASGVPALSRGTQILQVDGVDLVNGTSQTDVDALNAGLFPQNTGETHVFLVRDVASTTDRMITLVSANITPRAVREATVINTPGGPVGYLPVLSFGSFQSEAEIAAEITRLDQAGVSDLVLDLRYNGGGLLAVSAQLGFAVAGLARTNNRVFEDLRFNNGIGGVNPVTGSTNNAIPFISTGIGFSLANGTPLDTLNLGRVFVLSTDFTCSASESIINSLRGIDVDVVLIGETTCGKPFGFFPQDNCGRTYSTIQFQGVNDKGFGDYTDGFAPQNEVGSDGIAIAGCAVADDLSHPLGDPAEAMLAAALQFRSDGTCPAPPPVAAAPALADVGATGQDAAGAPLRAPEERRAFDPRDMRMPPGARR